MLQQNVIVGMKVKHKTRGIGYINRLCIRDNEEYEMKLGNVVFNSNEYDVDRLEGSYVLASDIEPLELTKPKRVFNPYNVVRRHTKYKGIMLGGECYVKR